MPKSKDQEAQPPKNLRPYLFHGLDLDWRSDREQLYCECPWCGREDDKFSVYCKAEKWRYKCFVCSEGGDVYDFLRLLWNCSDADTTADYYRVFAEHRSLLNPDTLMHWGLCRSILTGEWLVPGYTHNKNKQLALKTLYRYVETAKGYRLLPTPTLGHTLFGLNLYDKDKTEVYLCEGPWDPMVLWETLGQTKQTDDGLQQTASPGASLLADANVLAVPGCGIFFDRWIPYFVAKTVYLCYDNDHPRTHPKTGKPLKPAGLGGMIRAAKILSGAKRPPAEINYLRWGERGYDLERPDGFDVRDWITT